MYVHTCVHVTVLVTFTYAYLPWGDFSQEVTVAGTQSNFVQLKKVEKVILSVYVCNMLCHISMHVNEALF